MNRAQPPSTRLSLVILALLTGVAFGWLLRSLLPVQVAEAPVVRESSTAMVPEPASPLPTTVVASPTTLAATQPVPSSLPTEPLSSSQPTTAPTLTPTLQPTPSAAVIVGYAAHVVGEGESLASIAANGNSSVELIQRYNRLTAEPLAGRALIVPQLSGAISVLQNQPILIERGRNDRPWVAFTLDAGAGSEPTPRILQALRERNIRITFFLTGRWISENPELTRQIVADGHEIANHSFTHPDFRQLSDAQIAEELAETERVLFEVAGASARPLFRPPYGAYDQRVLLALSAQGYLPIYWTLDSLDSVGEPKTASFIFERVTGRLSPEQLRGAIILAHCGSEATAEALPAILDRFAELGLEVRTVSEVLGV